MAEVSSLIWHPVISQNSLPWAMQQAAGWLEKNANTPRLATRCCHAMSSASAKFHGQSWTLADFTTYLSVFMGDRSCLTHYMPS